MIEFCSVECEQSGYGCFLRAPGCGGGGAFFPGVMDSGCSGWIVCFFWRTRSGCVGPFLVGALGAVWALCGPVCVWCLWRLWGGGGSGLGVSCLRGAGFRDRRVVALGGVRLWCGGSGADFFFGEIHLVGQNRTYLTPLISP